jgi:D-lactate dehydrogenase
MAAVAFLEVEPQDTAHVKTAFPGSLILPSSLGEKGVIEQCKDAEILSIFIYSKVGGEELKKLPSLKLLVTRSVGYDHVDLDACKERGVTVCNVPDYGSHVIAEHVFALLLGTLRHIHEGDERVESGTFDYRGLRGMTLRGKTLGIVGTGKIGRRVAQIAHGFGMKILAVDRCRTLELEDLLGVHYVSLEELLTGSDIITLHAPALPETEHMINEAAITKMKQGVILVNTARGSLIDSHALLKGLQSGKIAYALLDVLEHEKNFQENKDLIAFPRVVTTPHIAFYSEESVKNIYVDCFDSIAQWKLGKVPDHVIRPPAVVCDLPGIRKDDERRD